LLGINGRLVRIEDPVDLSRGVTALLEDEHIREDSAADAVARAASMFDIARMIDDTHSLYETVLREK
jgi:glycosyltransferase involved in cell wall biosynthesis